MRSRRERVRRILRAARLLRATQSNGRLPENPATGRLQHRPNVARSTGSESGSAGCDATGGQIDGELPATIHALERAARYVGRLDPTLEGNESADGDAERLLELVERLRQSPAQSAPAQEPVATLEAKVSTLLARALTTGYGSTEAIYALANLAREPLFAAPPPDEARAWFGLLFRARETIRIGMAFINDSQEERDNWIGHGQMMDEEISAYLEKHK